MCNNLILNEGKAACILGSQLSRSQRHGSEFRGFSKEVDLRVGFPLSSYNDILIVTRVGFELAAPVL